VVIGTIMVLGTIAIISPSIRSNAASSRLQIAVGLGKGLFDSVRVLAESDWMTIANLNTSGTLYYIVASSSPFTVATGTESVQIVSTTYTRYFYVSDVGRDTNGFIVSP